MFIWSSAVAHSHCAAYMWRICLAVVSSAPVSSKISDKVLVTEEVLLSVVSEESSTTCQWALCLFNLTSRAVSHYYCM